MKVFALSFLVFSSFVGLQALDLEENSVFYSTLLNGELNEANIDYFLDNVSNDTTPWFDPTGESEVPVPESVDCSDMNSKISKVLKWLLANKVNLTRTIKMKFVVSTRKQPSGVPVFLGEKFDLGKSDFNIERRTVVITHGFLSSGSSAGMKQLKEAFLLWADVNVIVVDWSAVGKTVNYYKAAISTKLVGTEIARFLQQITNSAIEASAPNKPKWGKLHFVGHSLGSHISGVAAHAFKKLQNHWPVSRITGLDPAMPCFTSVNSELRLDPSDAEFVDVLHTSSSVKSTVGFGTFEQLGHADFYPNGGKRQPGCSRLQGSIFDYIWIPKTPVVQGTCSHSRATIYFIESLVQAAKGSCVFWAHPWDLSYLGAVELVSKTCDYSRCTEMGIRSEDHPLRGTFFVTTSRKAPFCVIDQKDDKEVRKQLLAQYKRLRTETI